VENYEEYNVLHVVEVFRWAIDGCPVMLQGRIWDPLLYGKHLLTPVMILLSK
jgi:hypothetical protein